jgi:uncharacterized protein YcfJ
MKLFITDKTTQNKVYLNRIAPTKNELANLIGSPVFIISDKTYTVNDVKAESDINNTLAGFVTGSLIGILGGPYGIAAGALIGGYLGNQTDRTEESKVNRFNYSIYGDE